MGFVLFHSSGTPFLVTWLNWLASDVIGVITVAPLIIGLAHTLNDRPTKLEVAEGLLTLAVLALVSAIGFGAPTHHWFTILPITLLLPLLLWLSARCRPVFAAATAFILALAIVWTITFGIGRLGDPSLPLADRVHAAQAALLALSTYALVLAAVFAERRRSEAALKNSNDRMQLALDSVAERNAQLALAGRAALVGSYTLDVNTGTMQVSEGYAAVHGLSEGTTETTLASTSTTDFVAALVGRVQSMANTHELLSSNQWQGVSLAELVRREFAPYATSNNTEISGPEIILGAEAGQAMAMVIHELVTNAAKHGALSTQDGRVLVRWNRQPNENPRGHLEMEWQEIGGPAVVASSKSGYGTSVVRELIPYELGGAVDLALAREGVRCRLEIPGERLTANYAGDRRTAA
jgi:two-component sensor histidine kinase